MISVGMDVSKEKGMVCMLRPYVEVVAYESLPLHGLYKDV